MSVSKGLKSMWAALLTAVVLLGFSLPGAGESSPAGVVLELTKRDRDVLATLGKGVVGKALPAFPLGSPAQLMPLREGEWVYRITAGEHKGREQKAVISRTGRKEDQNLWQRAIQGDTIEFFSFDKGAINLVSENDLEQNVISRSKPVFPVIFDGMKPGETSQVETAINIYDLHDPTDLKYEGRLKVTHTYVGAYEVSVPAGKYRTVLIRSTYEGKVGPGHVVDGGYVFYAEGVGIVASVERKHVTAFLFYNKRTKTPKVLIRK